MGTAKCHWGIIELKKNCPEFWIDLKDRNWDEQSTKKKGQQQQPQQPAPEDEAAELRLSYQKRVRNTGWTDKPNVASREQSFFQISAMIPWLHCCLLMAWL